MKQVKPLWRGWASGSVLTRTNTSEDIRPLVTHIFWPLISYEPSSPFLADVLIACTSEPSSGSDSEKAARISPVAMRGRYFCLCSSEPNFMSR